MDISGYQTLVEETIKLGFLALSAVVGPLLVLIVKRLADKYKLQLDRETQLTIEGYAQRAILYAETLAVQAANAQFPITGLEKRALAVRDLLDRFPGISPAMAEQIVETELPKLGLGVLAKVKSQLPPKAE